MVIAIALILLVMFGVVGGVVWYMLKKTDPKNKDTSENDSIKCAQEFLPFDNIREDMILLPNQQYRAVIECSSMNYHLKTPDERDTIEMSFQQFLNSITFPITFFLQTKTIDNSRRLKSLDEDIKKAVQDYPGVKAYADQFRRDLEDINTRIGNSHQKKRYIIVSFDEVSLLDNLSAEEQAHYAAKEVRNRSNIVIDNLGAVGVKAHIMNTKELIELVYSCYYRDDFSYAECIANEEAFKLFVDGEKDRFKELSKKEFLELLLVETKNRIFTNSLETTEDGQKLLQLITELKPKEQKGETYEEN